MHAKPALHVQACLIGGGNRLGDAVPVDEASDVIFGLTLMNDWSARDLQRWEMFPLGPFNSKNFVRLIIGLMKPCCCCVTLKIFLEYCFQ